MKMLKGKDVKRGLVEKVGKGKFDMEYTEEKVDRSEKRRRTESQEAEDS